MKEFSIAMALVDYLPVILFLLSCLIIIRDCRRRISSIWGVMFILGVSLVFAAGVLKATYKLLYAANVGDFEWMSRQFFSNQAFGFLLAGIGLVMCLTSPAEKRAFALLPTMALVAMMVIGLGAMDAALAYTAGRLKRKGALVCFIVSFFLLLSMGYLSSRDFTKASMNWIAQGINLAGQLLLFAGCRTLSKAGLKNY